MLPLLKQLGIGGPGDSVTKQFQITWKIKEAEAESALKEMQISDAIEEARKEIWGNSEI